MKTFIAPLICTITILNGCGGGSSSQSNSPTQSPTPSTSPTTPQESTAVNGGSLGNPTPIENNKAHVITEEANMNYFQIEVEPGQRMFIFSTLDSYLDNTSYVRCGDGQGIDHAGINLISEDIQACGNNFEHTFNNSGSVIFQLGYPYNNTGHFYVSIIGDEDNESVLDANGEGGLPDYPREIQTDSSNLISTISLSNFYAYEGVEGETIELTGFLNDNLSAQESSRCLSHTKSYDDHYAFGFSIMNSEFTYNCDTSFTYTFDENKTIIIHVRFLRNIDGYFMFSSTR